MTPILVPDRGQVGGKPRIDREPRRSVAARNALRIVVCGVDEVIWFLEDYRCDADSEKVPPLPVRIPVHGFDPRHKNERLRIHGKNGIARALRRGVPVVLGIVPPSGAVRALVMYLEADHRGSSAVAGRQTGPVANESVFAVFLCIPELL